MAPHNVPKVTNTRPPPQAPMKAITLPFRDNLYESRKSVRKIEWNASPISSFTQEQEVEYNGSASNINRQALSQNRVLPVKSDASDNDGQDLNSIQATSHEFGESTVVPSLLLDNTPLLGLESRSKELEHNTELPLEIEEAFSDLAKGNKLPSAHYQPVPEQSVSIRGGFLEVPQYINHVSTLSAGSQVSDGGQQDYINQRKKAIAKPPATRTRTDPLSHAHITKDNIVTLLFDALKKAWSLDGKQDWFLPIGEVERLITKEAVYRELNEQLGNAGKKDEEFVNQLKGAALEELAEKICHDEPLEENPLKYKSFRKTFATLVLAGKSLAIKQFIDGNISDLDLPLAAAGNSSYRDSNSLRRRNNRDEVLSCFDGWQLNEIEQFAKYQWRVTAPWFSRDEFNRVKHFSLYSEQILPFVNSPQERKSRRSNSTEGGTSQVYMIDIHPEHHNFHQEDIGRDGTIRVAIKSIKQQEDADRQLFEIEARALRRFRHKHVVTLLATYEQYDMYYLMFPRADADLVGFWKEVKPDRSHNGMVWLATQCEGMAHALMRLHHATFLDKSSTFPVHTMPKNSAGLGRHHSCASMSAIAPRADDEGATGRMGLAADDDSTTPQYRLTRRASTSNFQLMRQEQEQISRRCGCYSEKPGTHVPAGPKANDPPAVKKVWGRHGDIKPQNILWYRESRDRGSLGTLKLADFGQAELNSQWSRFKHRGKMAYSLTYRAPEFDIPPYITHASYDIWSLGCVYLQCVAWMMGGYNTVSEFAESRRSYDVLALEDSDVFFNTIINENGKEEAVLKPCIHQAIKKLQGHQNCTAYLNDLLSIIENEMLVVDYQKRGSCVRVREMLSALLQKGRGDVRYMCRPILDSETTELQNRGIMPDGSYKA